MININKATDSQKLKDLLKKCIKIIIQNWKMTFWKK